MLVDWKKVGVKETQLVNFPRLIVLLIENLLYLPPNQNVLLAVELLCIPGKMCHIWTLLVGRICPIFFPGPRLVKPGDPSLGSDPS